MSAVILLLLIGLREMFFGRRLLLARATSRTREIAVRLSIGGRTPTGDRQMVTEALLVSTVGGRCWAGGFSLSGPGLLVFCRPMPSHGNSLRTRGLSVRDVVSVAIGVLFGIAPAVLVSKTGLSDEVGLHRQPSVIDTNTAAQFQTARQLQPRPASRTEKTRPVRANCQWLGIGRQKHQQGRPR